MIADGMGGHVDGERASSLAIQAASRVLLRKFFDPLTLEPPFPSGKSVETLLNQAMQSPRDRCRAFGQVPEVSAGVVSRDASAGVCVGQFEAASKAARVVVLAHVGRIHPVRGRD